MSETLPLSCYLTTTGLYCPLKWLHAVYSTAPNRDDDSSLSMAFQSSSIEFFPHLSSSLASVAGVTLVHALVLDQV